MSNIKEGLLTSIYRTLSHGWFVPGDGRPDETVVDGMFREGLLVRRVVGRTTLSYQYRKTADVHPPIPDDE